MSIDNVSGVEVPQIEWLRPSDFTGLMNSGVIATRANERFREMLAAAPLIYGSKNSDGIIEWNQLHLMSTHVAFLFDIRELPKKECEHEPRIWSNKGLSCLRCGKELVATFKVKE